jgi:hypothetical protein
MTNLIGWRLILGNKALCWKKGASSQITIRFRSIADHLKPLFLQGKSFSSTLWIFPMTERTTAVVGNRQRLCSLHGCRALLLVREANTVQPRLCIQERSGNALDPLLDGRMIHGAQAQRTRFLFLQEPRAHHLVPFIRSGRRGSC